MASRSDRDPDFSILQLKLKKRFGEKKIKKIWLGNKIEKKQVI